VIRFIALTAFVCALLAAFAIQSIPAQGREAEHPSIAICAVFGKRYCLQALEVAWCESRFRTSARNGEYRGLFQLGAWERRRYGEGSDPWSQARAARSYFVASGRDWSPWSCGP
jgi:hypothetical protein